MLWRSCGAAADAPEQHTRRRVFGRLPGALGAYGIRANALAWGPQSINAQYDQEMVDERLRRLPLGRLGTPEDLVGPAVFLACEDSGWVNAHVLYAEGGYTSAAVTEDKFRPKLD